jgi:hypothetical protein
MTGANISRKLAAETSRDRCPRYDPSKQVPKGIRVSIHYIDGGQLNHAILLWSGVLIPTTMFSFFAVCHTYEA